MKKFIASVIVLIAFLMQAGSRYPYFIEIKDGRAMELDDSIFYDISRRVVFPVNKYEIPANSDFRKEILQQIERMDSLGHGFRGIIIRGGASPEGPLSGNVRLSHRRTRAVCDIIESSGRSIMDNAQLFEIPEDYKYLVYMMQQAADPDTETVRRIVDESYDTDLVKLKKKLRSVDNGRLWKRLLKQYFPDLRATRVVIFVSEPPLSETSKKEVSWADIMTSTIDYGISDTIFQQTIDMGKVKTIWVSPRRELLSVKTNLLYDFAYMPGYDRFCPIPNVAVEYYPLNGHFTYGASFDCAWWQHYNQHKFFQVRQYQLESRYYLRSGDILRNPLGEGAAFRGFYLQAYINTGLYSICFDSKRGWEGEAFGGGVGLGYVLPISKDGHWRLDFGLQAGYLWTKYDPYQWECPVDPTEHDNKYYYKTTLGPSLFKRRQHRMSWIGPTRIGISITYDLLYRKNHSKGASFKSSEMLEF